jgi:type II secretory pathway component PulJ
MRGVTLVEVVVTMLIFTLIIGGMYGVLNVAKTNYDTNLVLLNLQREARQGMGRLTREIRQASLASIVDKTQNRTSITFNTSDATDVTYSLVSGQLKRQCPSCTDMIIANDIITLVFSPVVGNLQKVTLEASKTFNSLGQNRTLTFPLTEQVEVRNTQ